MTNIPALCDLEENVNNSASYIDVIDAFANMAYVNGPFFFAIFLMIVASAILFKRYEAVRSFNPPPSEAEIKGHLITYMVTMGFFLILVTICSWWWFSKQEPLHVFKFSIVDVN